MSDSFDEIMAGVELEQPSPNRGALTVSADLHVAYQVGPGVDEVDFADDLICTTGQILSGATLLELGPYLPQLLEHTRALHQATMRAAAHYRAEMS